MNEELLSLLAESDALAGLRISPAEVVSYDDEQLGQDVLRYGQDLTETDMLINKTLFEVVSDYYAIGIIRSINFPSVVSSTSKKAIITTDEGQFFLKQKPTYCADKASRENAAAVQSYTYANGGNEFVPLIIGANKNTYLQFGDNYYFLTEYRSGRQFRGNVSDIRDAGATLGKLHRIFTKIQLPHQVSIMSSRDEALKFVDMADNLTGGNEIIYKKEAIGLLYETVSQSDDLEGDCPVQVCHGDYSPFNLVYQINGVDDKVQAVNDFDNCGRYARVRELAEAILTFSDGINYIGGSSAMRWPISQRMDIDKARSFYNAYISHNDPLSDREQLAFPSVLSTLWVELMALALVRGDYGYKEVLDAYRMGGLPVYVKNNYDKIFK